MKSLTKSVEDRYQSAAAMRADIERFLAGKPVVAPVVPVVGAEDCVRTAGDPTTIFAARRRRRAEDERKKRWPVVLTGLGVLALLVLAVVVGPMLFNSPPEEKTVPQVVNMTRAAGRAADRGGRPDGRRRRPGGLRGRAARAG